MADGMMRCLFATLSPPLMERLVIRLSPRAGEGWGEGIFRTLLTLFAALFSVAATAEELPDPTRPPASLVAPAPAGGAAANQPAGLQSIIISKTRRAAIIAGETVELGGKYGDAKLVEVNEGSVVLRSAQGRQVMTLFPDVKITARQETKTRPQLSADEAQSGKQKNKPVAHKERK